MIRVPKQEALTLSFAQERVWFLHKMSPDSSIFNIVLPRRIKGGLNVSALLQSLAEIVHRHEVLRSIFPTKNGKPISVISPVVNSTLKIICLREMSKTEQEAEALELATKEAQRPFDLTQGPLFRSTLLQLDEDEYLLILTTHQIVFDYNGPLKLDNMLSLFLGQILRSLT